MAATATEYAWPRGESQPRSPDTLSPLWPDRPIRPLPKNRLSSKLSPEVADAIVYPPNPPSSSPLFSFPYGLADVKGNNATTRVNGHSHGSPTHCTCGAEHDESEEEEIAYDHPSYRRSLAIVDGARLDNVSRRLMEASRMPTKAPPAPASIASSADGYESFENTSNKKKRKIPLSGGSSAHHLQLSAELANMGISSKLGGDGAGDEVNGDGSSQQYQAQSLPVAPAVSNPGISGAGRGRYGRQAGRNERRPLTTTVNPAVNGYASSLSAKSRGGNWKGDGTKTSPSTDQGIISAAIASAAEQQPSTPQQGKENISLLSQQSPNSTTSNTQFTFTCESDSSNKMVWPGQDGNIHGSPSPNTQNAAAYGSRNAQPNYRAMPPNGQAPHSMGAPRSNDPRYATGQPNQGPLPPAAHNPPPPPPRRRQPSKEYALAARQRRLQQEYSNYHHKPTKDSMWICEFCEYEDIWGTPPRALLRQYEIKDRAERKKAEEKRRLLEKAKAKNRKGKKGGKGRNGGGLQNPANPGQPYDPNLDNVPLPPDGQGDEYYDDEYDDGYDPPSPSDPLDPRYAGDYGYGPNGDGHLDSAHQLRPPLPPAAPAA